MIIKVCGMRLGDNIRRVEALGVDMIGFIFYEKSSRYVVSMPDYLPQQAKRVGVFVDERLPVIVATAAEYNLDYIQLHGDESPEFCLLLKEFGLGVIKAISVTKKEDLCRANDYDRLCDYLLFDTKVAEKKGGSGVKFDWQILSNYTANTPFLLSGGISPNDANELLALRHKQLAGIDLNSRFEIKPALKNIELIEQFLQNINRYEPNK